MVENCRYLELKNLKITNLPSNIDAKQAKKWRITAKSRDTDLGVKEKINQSRRRHHNVCKTNNSCRQEIHDVRHQFTAKPIHLP